MKNKTLAILSPLCLCLLASNARAALEPFTIAASESLQHHTNINHSADALATADWMSQTELSAAVDQALGRDKLVASAAVDFNHYGKTADKALNATGYRAAGEFDWSTIGDLSGALGADINRRQYLAGSTAEVPATATSEATTVTQRNLQTDSHGFARVTLGGDSRWQIYGGGDVNQRKYSADAFSAYEEHQWSANAGTRYSTSPDLSFGLQGMYTKGQYPHGGVPVAPATEGGPSDFSSRTVSLTSRLQASGNSSLDGNIGYTSDSNDALSGDRHFISGALNWRWTPPSHISVVLGLTRSSDADAATGATSGTVNVNNLQGTSINNAAHLEATYAFTPKTSLDASTDYTQRKYTGVQQLSGNAANGTTRTVRFYLSAHFQPTRTTDLSCGGGRETRRGDVEVLDVNNQPDNLVPAYSDNYFQCIASIKFD